MFSVITLFCEDIREEKAGTVSIIGIWTDNIVVDALPAVIPKFGIYVRFRFPIDVKPPETIALRMVHPDSTDAALAVFNQDIIQKAWKQSADKGASYVGLIGTAIMTPLLVKQAGKITVFAKVDGKDVNCGVLSIIQSGAAP